MAARGAGLGWDGGRGEGAGLGWDCEWGRGRGRGEGAERLWEGGGRLGRGGARRLVSVAGEAAGAQVGAGRGRGEPYGRVEDREAARRDDDRFQRDGDHFRVVVDQA